MNSSSGQSAKSGISRAKRDLSPDRWVTLPGGKDEIIIDLQNHMALENCLIPKQYPLVTKYMEDFEKFRLKPAIKNASDKNNETANPN